MSSKEQTEQSAEILVPYDSWDASSNALKFAQERAEKTGESIQIIHIEDEDTSRKGIKRKVEKDMDEVDNSTVSYALKFAERDGGGSIQSDADVADIIAHHVSENDYGLVIMGRAEQTGKVHNFVIGSVTESLMSDIDTPVTFVPGER